MNKEDDIAIDLKMIYNLFFSFSAKWISQDFFFTFEEKNNCKLPNLVNNSVNLALIWNNRTHLSAKKYIVKLVLMPNLLFNIFKFFSFL